MSPGSWTPPTPRPPSRRPMAAPRARGQLGVPGGEDSQPVLEGRGVGQVDVLGGDRRVDQVEVGVHEAGDRDLAGLQLDAQGVRVGPRLELDGAAGEGDATAANADRLDPAEAVFAGERRGPAT